MVLVQSAMPMSPVLHAAARMHLAVCVAVEMHPSRKNQATAQERQPRVEIAVRAVQLHLVWGQT